MKTKLDKLITRLKAAHLVVVNEYMTMIDEGVEGGPPFATVPQWQEVNDAIMDATIRLEAFRDEMVLDQLGSEAEE